MGRACRKTIVPERVTQKRSENEKFSGLSWLKVYERNGKFHREEQFWIRENILSKPISIKGGPLRMRINSYGNYSGYFSVEIKLKATESE